MTHKTVVALLTVALTLAAIGILAEAVQEYRTAQERYARRVSAFRARVACEVRPGQVLMRGYGGLVPIENWRDTCVGVALEHGEPGATIAVLFKGRTE